MHAGELMRHENDLEFSILGPLGVRFRGSQVRIRGWRERAVLASLLLAGGHAVSLDRLVETLWDADPPRAAAKAVRNSVSALRQRFSEVGAPPSVIETEPDGYRLPLHDCYLDAQDFVVKIADARRVAAAGQPAQAAAELRAALGLWQGQALQGLRSTVIEAGAASLDEQQLAALEECLDLELALGRERQLVSELRVLTTEHPLRERLAGQLMIALYRSGRQAEALEAYHQLARRLVDSLGIDPAAEITRLYEGILCQDPALAAASVPAGRTRSPGQDGADDRDGVTDLRGDSGRPSRAMPIEQQNAAPARLPLAAQAATGPDHLPAPGRSRLRMRRSLVIGCALGVAVALTAVVVARTAASGPSRAPAAVADRPPGATSRPPIMPETERRHGPLVLVPGQVADLDTMAPGWGIVKAPGLGWDDVWFSITDYGLHGDRDADIAILPVGDIGTFNECAQDSDYGVTLDAPHIRPGQLICDITNDRRVALLRIVDVQYTASHIPDQITFDVVVWVRLHTT